MGYALRDSIGANLDRMQIIKGWLNKNSKTHKHIYDMAVSDECKIGKDGRCKILAYSTVNITDARYTDTMGNLLLTAHTVILCRNERN